MKPRICPRCGREVAKRDTRITVKPGEVWHWDCYKASESDRLWLALHEPEGGVS